MLKTPSPYPLFTDPPAGVLLTCTCSAAMAQSEEFRYMLMDAAKQVTPLDTVNHIHYPPPI